MEGELTLYQESLGLLEWNAGMTTIQILINRTIQIVNYVSKLMICDYWWEGESTCRDVLISLRPMQTNARFDIRLSFIEGTLFLIL